MRTLKHLPTAAGALVFVLATAILPAADKLDVDRQNPVPAGEPVPVQDFFREPILQQPVLNPSGTDIAAIVASGVDQSTVMVYGLNTRNIETVRTREGTNIDEVYWLGDDMIAYRLIVRKRPGFSLGAADTGALRSAHAILQGVDGRMIAIPPGDRLHPLFELAPHSVGTGRYSQVVTLDAQLDTGEVRDLAGNGDLMASENLDNSAADNIRHITGRRPVLETPDGFPVRYLADKDGRLEFAVIASGGGLNLHQLTGDGWDKCPENLEEYKVVGAANKPGEIVVLGPSRSDLPRPLEVIQAASGNVVEVLVQDKDYDADARLYRDPASHDIVGALYDRAGPFVMWFSDAYRSLQKLVDGLFPGKVVRIIGNDEQGKMVLISSFSDRQPPVYSWINLEKRKAGLIKDSCPWLDPKRMRPMSVIKFHTRDGRALDAYVTMPAGATKQHPPPLVVLPHAEPWGRDTWGFDAEAQYLASRGYAVLQPNYRGSSGTTWMFPVEDAWACRKMSDDVTDATNALAGSGLVDPKRMAIMGTSFGGFLALSGAASEPGLYRCAVAVCPVTDLGVTFARDPFATAYYARMASRLGQSARNAVSPVSRADHIRASVLLVTGEDDDPSIISGAKDLEADLGRNHVSVESVAYPDESGRIRHLAHKVDLYSRIADFLARNLGPTN